VLLQHVSALQEPTSGNTTDIFSQPDQQNMGSQFISKFVIYLLHFDTPISSASFVIKVKPTANKMKPVPLVAYSLQKT
jgi:hypothetical protein